jgi:tetratricopeptide (TPR) repeat protein
MRRFSSFVVIGVLVLCHSSWGEDQIRLKSGEVLRGTATKFDEGSMTLTFKFDKGTLGYSQADLAEVILVERPGVVEGRKAFAEGNLDEVVTNWKGPVGEFMGVDSPWVLECTGGLGQTYLAQGKVAEAEGLYGKMKKFYPTGSAALRAEVGLAEATSGRDVDGLLKKLDELKGQLKESLRPLRADREGLAEFYFSRGGAYEKKGEVKKALEDYLRVSALYPDPPSLGRRAEKKAQALRSANKDLVTD